MEIQGVKILLKREIGKAPSIRVCRDKCQLSWKKKIFECGTVYDFTKVEKVAEEAQVSKKISGASNKIYKTKAR